MKPAIKEQKVELHYKQSYIWSIKSILILGEQGPIGPGLLLFSYFVFATYISSNL